MRPVWVNRSPTAGSFLSFLLMPIRLLTSAATREAICFIHGIGV